MKAIVYDSPRNFTYRDVPDPKMESDEVLIKVHACGVCGTDLHIHEGEFGPRFPLIPGHEFTGEIVDVGTQADGLKKGQRVVANSNMACGECFYCMRGDYLLCEQLSCYGVNLNGGFAEYLKIKADRVFPIRNLSAREAIMVEPTSCAGPTGQVLAQLLKLNGAANLVVAAPAGPKLDLAAKLSADQVVPMDRNDPEVHRKRLQEISPKGFDAVIEATGAPSVGQEAIRFVRRRGTILIYGVYPENANISINPFDMFRNELTIKGSFAQIDSFERALNYLDNGRIKVNEIVTQEIPLKDWDKALDLAWKRQGIKTALIPG
jgi:D-arabinitol dehydrogenase (NADP+)